MRRRRRRGDDGDDEDDDFDDDLMKLNGGTKLMADIGLTHRPFRPRGHHAMASSVPLIILNCESMLPHNAPAQRQMLVTQLLELRLVRPRFVNA
jgi:hypothetical protein